jgi:hypothetical protein
VIVTLQVLGQTAFDFRLSIAQILVSVLTCAILELAIVFRRTRTIVWPASALLTGNGVAFVLRVPGTEHGDWWSMHGAWIFAATAAFALLSKYIIRFRGRHVFNPSNIGLVVCFLAMGPARADPLALWWGPMSPWLALALALIVAGGFAILGRLRLLDIAIGFWLAFAAAAAVLAASGHEMTAAWHVGPISGWDFWRVLVLSPEVLVFLFFMITDPKTIPAGRDARRAYAVGIGVLAVLLIAPWTSEFATKVAILGALAIVTGARPLLVLLVGNRPHLSLRRVTVVGGALAAAAVTAGLVVAAGIPARPGPVASAQPSSASELPAVIVLPSDRVAAEIDRATALAIASDVVADLRAEAEALTQRSPELGTQGAAGAQLAALWETIRAAGSTISVPEYHVDQVRLALEPGDGQGPPVVVASLEGTVTLATVTGSPPAVAERTEATPFKGTFELVLADGRYLIADTRSSTLDELAPPQVETGLASGAGLGGVTFEDVAGRVGLDFQHGAFHFRVSHDPVAMMGGGVCWLDYDNDGWLDLYAVNSYSIELDVARWREQGGLPRSGLFHNVEGRFTDVGRGSGADVEARGNGCVAADFDLDGRTDLYVTAAGYDSLLWNEGGGRFVEGARAAGISSYGWHSAAAVGDVNGDRRPDLFVAGYADLNAPVPDAALGFPTTYAAVRDRLYLNEGLDSEGRATFREIGLQAGIEQERVDHGLGAVFTDVDGDGRLDLYVANDLDPNRLYMNLPDEGDLGFRFEDRAPAEGLDDANAGMGVAAADYNGDGSPDLIATNSHEQLHAVSLSERAADGQTSFRDARPEFATAFDTTLAGWGVSWADVDLDSHVDLVIANGAVPVTDLATDAEPVQLLARTSAGGQEVVDVSAGVGLGERARAIGRGLATADYDNDGDLDVAVNSIGGALMLLENRNATGHWLEVSVAPFSPGALVTAVLPDGRRLVREIQAGGSYLSSEDPRVHFGLGGATRVKTLVVRVPDGRETRLDDVATDRLVTVTR